MTPQDILGNVVKEYYDYKQSSPFIKEDETLTKDVFERLEYEAFLSGWTKGRNLMWADHIQQSVEFQLKQEEFINKKNQSLWSKLKSWLTQ